MCWRQAGGLVTALAVSAAAAGGDPWPVSVTSNGTVHFRLVNGGDILTPQTGAAVQVESDLRH